MAERRVVRGGTAVQAYFHLEGEPLPNANLYIDEPGDGRDALDPFQTNAAGLIVNSRGGASSAPAQLDAGRSKFRIFVSEHALPDPVDPRHAFEIALEKPIARSHRFDFKGFDWPGHAWYNPTDTKYVVWRDTGGTTGKGFGADAALAQVNAFFTESGALADYKALVTSLLSGIKTAFALSGAKAATAADEVRESILNKFGKKFALSLVPGLLGELFGDEKEIDRLVLRVFAKTCAAMVGDAAADRFDLKFDDTRPADLVMEEVAEALKDKFADGVEEKVLERLAGGAGRLRLRKLGSKFSGTRGFALVDAIQGRLSMALYLAPYGARKEAYVIVGQGGPRTLPLKGTNLSPLRLPCSIVPLVEVETPAPRTAVDHTDWHRQVAVARRAAFGKLGLTEAELERREEALLRAKGELQARWHRLAGRMKRADGAYLALEDKWAELERREAELAAMPARRDSNPGLRASREDALGKARSEYGPLVEDLARELEAVRAEVDETREAKHAFEAERDRVEAHDREVARILDSLTTIRVPTCCLDVHFPRYSDRSYWLDGAEKPWRFAEDPGRTGEGGLMAQIAKKLPDHRERLAGLPPAKPPRKRPAGRMRVDVVEPRE